MTSQHVLEAAQKWYESLLALSYAKIVESIDMIHIKGSLPQFFNEFSGTKLACTSVHLEGRVENGVEMTLWGGARFFHYIEFSQLYIITIRQDDLVPFRVIPQDIATELLKMPELALYITERAEDSTEILCFQLKLMCEPTIVDSTLRLTAAFEQPNKSVTIAYITNKTEMTMGWYQVAVQNESVRRVDIKSDTTIKYTLLGAIVSNLEWRTAIHGIDGLSNCNRVVTFRSFVEFDVHRDTSTDIVAISTYKNPLNVSLLAEWGDLVSGESSHSQSRSRRSTHPAGSNSSQARQSRRSISRRSNSRGSHSRGSHPRGSHSKGSRSQPQSNSNAASNANSGGM